VQTAQPRSGDFFAREKQTLRMLMLLLKIYRGIYLNATPERQKRKTLLWDTD